MPSGETSRVLAGLVVAVALAAYPSPTAQGLTAGPPTDRPYVPITRSVRRPLHLLSIRRGAACPVSQPRDVDPRYSPALGRGPVYAAAFDATSTLHYAGANFPTPWTGNKVLWIVDRRIEAPY